MTKTTSVVSTSNSNFLAGRRQRNSDNQLIKKFMSDRDLPEWYRGLSPFQIKAAESLLSSIRDDSEQGTSHRVREDLIKLGVQPLVGHRKIKLAMRLSRGSDLAFLWFLMELYYHPAKEKKGRLYSVNEQIMISAISHLDTIPTLRELDKMLPKYIKPRPAKKHHRKMMIEEDYILPYFEKQSRPQFWAKKLTLQEMDNVPKLGRYEVYTDPNFVVANECYRWFSTYELDQSKRITKRILDTQINNIFFKAQSATEVEKNPIFCEQHARGKRIREQMLDELRIARKKACEKYFDLDGHVKDQSYKRVVDMLNEQIALTEAEFSRIENRIDPGMMSSIKHKVNSETKCDLYINRSKPNIYDTQLNGYDHGHATVPTNRQKYFVAPTGHTPYKFNYETIFDLGVRDPIKDAIRTALTGHSSGNISEHNYRAVKQCCKDMWNEEVKKFRAEYARQQREKRKQKPPPEDRILKFDDVKTIDPRDKKLMDRLLYTAIKEIRKDRKFVLASLPDAYKTPVLREWVRKRYGMVYTREEKRRTFEISKKIFHIMRYNKVNVRLPILDDLADSRRVTYACKKYLLRKSNFIRDKYYRDFKDNFLEKARIYWGAVRPYQCSNGPPRSEFFSYLPARANDVYMFRPWRVHEYIPAKEEWDRRMKAKRAELMY